MTRATDPGSECRQSSGESMYRLISELFPICRSITGNGVRQTLHRIQEEIPLQMDEIPSGTKVFDWTIPPEWNIDAAYVSKNGQRLIDFSNNNLHIVNYSQPVQETLDLEQLNAHLHSLTDAPDWIPYHTSYYRPTWGFCLTDSQRKTLEPGKYQAVIDSRLDPDGSMTMGEFLVPGKSDREILIACHTCHPSLANDNLSAIVVAAELAKFVASQPRKLSYRFLFIPGTIGAIAWLAKNPLARRRIVGGLVLALLGDSRHLTYKKSRQGNARIDHCVEYALKTGNREHQILSYEPFGYNERQFNAPGIALPIGRLSRSVEAGYPEYHTSADNLDLVRPEALQESLVALQSIVSVLEADQVYHRSVPPAEPLLGPRGLYPLQSASGHDPGKLQQALMWNLGMSDGATGLTAIANRSGLDFELHEAAAELLVEHTLLERDAGDFQSPQVEQSLSTPSWPSESSLEQNRRAHELIPGGAHTYAKGDDQFPANAPRFFVRGSGCYAFDNDGNRFLEYGIGLRSVGLGHAYPSVVDAVARQVQLGANFTRPTTIELETAELLLRILPAADMVKFTKNGSDATTAAIRLARARTGRHRVLLCQDQPFFSVDDWFIGTTPMNAGIPAEAYSPIVRFPYDNLGELERLFAAEPNGFACLMMEAANYSEPSPGYLHAVQALCKKHDTLFVLDETITGFRWNVGGAQAEYGLDPDLSTFGKAMGNGFAVAALAGKEEHMRLGGLDHGEDRVFLLSYTHGAETHSLAAAQATIRTYLDEPVIDTMHRNGQLLKDGITQHAKELGVSEHFYLLGRGCNVIFVTEDAEGKRSQGYRTLFLQELVKQGICAPSLVISYSHGAAEVEATIEAFRVALKTYALALEDGYEKYLIGSPSKPVFRKKN